MRKTLFLSLFLTFSFAYAQDRAGLIGQAVVIPYQFEPQATKGDETYAVDLGYFFSENWMGLLSWEFALRGTERINVAFGARYLTRIYSLFKPYIGGEFLYLIDPTNDLGWRSYVGFEYDLQKITGNNNLRFTIQTGLSGIAHLHANDDLFWEIVRTGISWSY